MAGNVQAGEMQFGRGRFTLTVLLTAQNLLLYPDQALAQHQAAPKLSDVFDMLQETPVEVSSKTAQAINVAPSIVSVLDASQLAALGFTTLREVLNHTTGFFVAHFPNGEVIPVVRGVAMENGISVLIDGVPVLDAVTGAFAHYDMSLEGVQRVEILRGPGAAVHGESALLSVVNIVTYTEENEAKLGLTAGLPITDQALRGGGFVRAPFSIFGRPNNRIALSVFEDQSPEYSITQDGAAGSTPIGRRATSYADPKHPDYVPSRSIQRTHAAAFLDLEGPAGLTLKSRAIFRQLSPLLAPSIAASKSASTLVPEGAYQRRDLLLTTQLGLQRRVFGSVQLNISARHLLNHRWQGGLLTAPFSDFQGGGPIHHGVKERLSYANHTVEANLGARLQLPYENRLHFGLSARYQFLSSVNYAANVTFREDPSGGAIGPIQCIRCPLGTRFSPRDETGKQFLLPDSTRGALGIFAQNTFSYFPWLDLVTGLRLDLYSDLNTLSDLVLSPDAACENSPQMDCVPKGYSALQNGKRYQQLSPRAGLIFKWGDEDAHPITGTIKALYGRAYIPPPIIALTNQTRSSKRPGRVISEPLLRPTVGDTFELAVDMNVGAYLIARTSGFVVHTSKEVTFDASSDTFLNSAKRTMIGGELELKGALIRTTHLKLFYGLGLMVQTNGASSERLLGLSADIYPNLVANGTLVADLRTFGRLGTAVRGAAQSNREPFDTRPALKRFVLVDLSYAVDIERITLRFNMDDVFNAQYRTPLPDFVLGDDHPAGGRRFFIQAEVKL